MSNWDRQLSAQANFPAPKLELSGLQIGCLVIVLLWGLTALPVAFALVFASMFFPPLFLVLIPLGAACALSISLLPALLFLNDPLKLVRLSAYFTLGSFNISAIAFWVGPLLFAGFLTLVSVGHGGDAKQELIFWRALPYFLPLVVWYAIGLAGHIGALKGRLFA